MVSRPGGSRSIMGSNLPRTCTTKKCINKTPVREAIDPWCEGVTVEEGAELCRDSPLRWCIDLLRIWD
jgi:hypothetical protein